ncbi:MAG: hypothetical protein COY42_01485 [Armatimonadetes bacterium CG_4_10_14_0_8_um_filter_66_14]|nr:sigma-70 family RNA polymerase sigma factor [Armatimonadota bacterium]OIO94238.1 MAG: hypothetical protein AUJ96_29070 [Armatimonadetes bacterium CG2_30_66_41]PIX47001.1 MAG: hypothetical protein COZ57_09700 [Armatimonadetes bacterium CG_4_8_14_3_um_filter_66_20]PIZ50449.1 MAG: hypothetical protein COY42_01485 [Armatimonadetes bacterium CG_4_10_14_0_8_um_filter_66_14]NCQ28044.1 sigma-70 family RNA polymerase sigma factor [Armatimonadota bacterium]
MESTSEPIRECLSCPPWPTGVFPLLLERFVSQWDRSTHRQIRKWFILHAEEHARRYRSPKNRQPLPEEGVHWVAKRVVEPAMRGLTKLSTRCAERGWTPDASIYLAMKVKGMGAQWWRLPQEVAIDPAVVASLFDNPHNCQALWHCLETHFPKDPTTREVFWLTCVHGLKQHEAATVLGITRENVGQRLSKAARTESFRDCLKENLELP